MTPAQISLARHALGLPNTRRTSYRNHYVAGVGSPECVEWNAMVAANDAQRRAGNELTGGDDLFWLTRQGAEKALAGREKLDLEKFPKNSKANLAAKD